MGISGDRIFNIVTAVVAATAAVILAITAYTLINGSVPIVQNEGLSFFTGIKWNPAVGREIYGALPYLEGTLVTSAIALIIGVPLSLGIAIFLAEMSPPTIRVPISYLVELLAAVPSVIFGLWGLFVFRFYVRDYVEVPLNKYLGWIPTFSGTPYGLDVLTAGLILAIMIIPTVSSISREVLRAVPSPIREGAYSIGATRWEVVSKWVISYGRSGIFGAAILGLGRAVGETMAVTMVIGNTVGPAAVPTSLLKGSQTMASLIASNVRDSSSPLSFSAYIGVGLMLMILGLAINVIAQLMVTRLFKVKGGAVE
jgi:phosphate transport system permease protein